MCLYTYQIGIAFTGGYASVEIFFAMTFINNKFRNKMGDSILDDCLVTFIKRDIFLQLSEEEIINTFMAIRRRRPDKKK